MGLCAHTFRGGYTLCLTATPPLHTIIFIHTPMCLKSADGVPIGLLAVG